MQMTVLFETVNVLLVLFLLKVYVENYRQMKTPLGLGLIIFSGFLLLQNITAAYFHFTMVDYYSTEVMAQAFVLTGLETVALAVLSWVTWKD